MTTTNFRKILIDIAKDESSENKIAKVIAYYYPRLNLAHKESLFDSLLSLIELSEGQSFDFDKLTNEISLENIDVSEYENRDYRIREIEISNFRGIPSLEESDNIPYGINLVDESGHVSNAIILANNGVGKSSVFSGLEMIYAQEIGEKKLRSISPEVITHKEYDNYIKRIGNNSDAICKVKTVNGEFSLEKKIFDSNLLDIFKPSSHFITEYDIVSNGWLDYSRDDSINYSFHNLIAKSLGLDEFITFQRVSEQIPSYRRSKETSSRNSINKEIEDNNIHIQNNKALIQSKNTEIEDLNINSSTNETNDRSSSINTLNQLKNKVFFKGFDEIEYKKSIDLFIEKYREYLSTSKSKKVNNEKNFLDIGTELLHEFDDCPFCLGSNKTIDEIRAEVEIRLKQLESLQFLDKDVREAFRKATDNIWTVMQSINRNTEIFNLERGELIPFPNLEVIRQEEDRFFISATTLVNDEELADFVYEFKKTSVPQSNDFEKLYSLLTNNKIIFEDHFVELGKQMTNIIEKRNFAIDNEIDEQLKQDDNLNINQRIINLKNEIIELKNKVASIEERNKSLEPQLRLAEKKVEYLNQIKNEMKVFNSKFKLQVDKLVTQGFIPIKQTVEEVLNDYFVDDNQLELQINLKDTSIIIDQVEYTTSYIVAEIIDKNTQKSLISPENYFNTFRFKLFCLMICLSIAVASRKNYKINMPIVMDDLFFGSDFVNKNTFSGFVQKIIKLFHKHTPALPLQFILFTHDDTIFRSSLDALENLKLENSVFNETVFSRMFDLNDKEKSQFEDGSEYWDLLYKLPKQILIN